MELRGSWILKTKPESSVFDDLLASLKAREAPKIDEGYLSAEEWGKREGRSPQSAERALRKLMKGGIAERKRYLIASHWVNHYKLKT